jgi:pilus assembly protein CpaE
MRSLANPHDPAIMPVAREPQLSTEGAVDCLAVVSDNQTHDVVSAVCTACFPLLRMRDGGSREAMAILAEGNPPSVLILDVSDTPKPLTAILPIMATFPGDMKIIVIGSLNDIALYRDMIEAGVIEYLVKPVTEKALVAALTRLSAPTPAATAAAAQPQRRAMIAVLGTRGGVGSSTFAVNLAWLIANEHKQRTCLLDLDLQNGTIALALDVEPTRGLRDALENPSRIDSLFISSAAVKIGDRLSVMAAEESFADEVHYDPAALDLLLQELGRQSDAIVIDLPRSAASVRGRVLAAATEVVLVTELTLAGLRDAIRLTGTVQQAAANARLIVVANRSTGKDPVTRSDFEKALGHKIDYLVPEDGKSLAAAASAGKPLATAAPASKVLVPIKAFAVSMFATGQKPRKRFFWRAGK